MRKSWKLSLGLLMAVALLLGVGSLSQEYFERQDAEEYPAPGILISINGTKLHLRCVGEGSPTVVMIAGAGTPSVASYELQDRISPETRVCSYDRPGLGWSEPASRGQSISDVTLDLHKLLFEAGETGPFILAAESYGGLIALLAALEFPDDIAGFFLIDSSEPELWFDQTAKELGQLRRHTATMNFGWHTGIVRAGLDFGQPAWVDKMSLQNRTWFRVIFSRHMPGYGEYDAAFRLTDPSTFDKLETQGLGNLPITVLAHGKVPSGISPGFEDRWMAAQKKLATYSKASKLIIAENVDHAIAGEDPDFVAAQVLLMIEHLRNQDTK